MSWFEYEGLTPGGTAIAGRVEAVSREQAIDELAGMQIDVRELQGVKALPRRVAGLTDGDLIFFNEQLASLADAGIALDEGLGQLARDVTSPKLRRWVEGLVSDLRRGVPVDKAIASREKGLPILYSRVIRAGIDSGQLAATLLNLNHHLRLIGNTRRILWEIMTYPLIVAVLALTVVSMFFMLVVTQFDDIFDDFGIQLPDLTRLLIGIAHEYPTILMVSILSLAAVIVAWNMLRFGLWGRKLRESIILLTPIIGQVHRTSLIARFMRSVSTSLATGIQLPQAMRLGADATGSTLLIKDAEYLAGEVESGHSIFSANQTARIIPPLFGYCIQVSVGREELPSAIAKLAHSYENRAVHTQAMLRVVLAPAMIIVLGLFMAFGVVGMFLPLVSLINAVSG